MICVLPLHNKHDTLHQGDAVVENDVVDRYALCDLVGGRDGCIDGRGAGGKWGGKLHDGRGILFGEFLPLATESDSMACKFAKSARMKAGLSERVVEDLEHAKVAMTKRCSYKLPVSLRRLLVRAVTSKASTSRAKKQ